MIARPSRHALRPHLTRWRLTDSGRGLQ